MDAIKDKSVDAKSLTTYWRPVGFKEKRSDSSKNVYAVSEPEGDQRRVTDPIWSLKVFNIEKLLVKKGEPVLYCLKDGPKRGFVREELQIVPPGTELPPEGIRWFEKTIKTRWLLMESQIRFTVREWRQGIFGKRSSEDLEKKTARWMQQTFLPETDSLYLSISVVRETMIFMEVDRD